MQRYPAAASRAHRSSRKTAAVCSSCGRQKARMGTLLPADATRDKRSMLITPVALLEGWCRCQSLDIWRQTPCKDLLGRQPGHAAELQRHTRSLVLPDSQRTYKKRPIRPKETTPRVRHAATPSPSVPRALAATALARPLPLATPSAAPLFAISTTVCARFDGLAPSHWSPPRRGARPLFGQLFVLPSRKTNCASCYTCQYPHHSAVRGAPDRC